MEDPIFGTFVRQLMMEDIIPSLSHPDINVSDAQAYASSVIDRFRNPHIGHRWISITVNYSRKLEMRNLPLIRRALDQLGMISERMAFAMAAYLRFMKVEAGPDGRFRGGVDGHEYEVQDEFSAFYADLWKTQDDPKALVQQAFAQTGLWGDDLGKSSAFIDAVAAQLAWIMKHGSIPTSPIGHDIRP